MSSIALSCGEDARSDVPLCCGVAIQGKEEKSFPLDMFLTFTFILKDLPTPDPTFQPVQDAPVGVSPAPSTAGYLDDSIICLM